MFKKVITFIMIFTLFFTFVFDTNIALATTATFGDIYGTELGSEMLAFLLASLAVGVTYRSLVEVEQLFKASEPINWDEILGSAPEPPPGGGHNPNKKLITALLLGVPGGAFLSSIFGDLIAFFQGLGSTEGENIIGGDIFIKNGYSARVYSTPYPYHDRFVDYRIVINNKDFYLGAFGNNTHENNILKSHNITITNIEEIGPNLVVTYSYKIVCDEWKGFHYVPYVHEGDNGQFSVHLSNFVGTTPEEAEEPIIYNVKNDSPIITNIPPTTIPQPDISVVPGIKTITTPQGEEKLIYPGDFEDLVDEIVNNTSWEDILNLSPGSNPYIVTETEQGLNINTGVESPYPDINTDPIEDTATYQGTTIGLLQSIINWLSLIRNDISSLPDKFFEVPSDLSLNFDNLKLNGFQDRFPFSIPWDIASAIGVFSSSPTEPDLTIDMDTNYFSLNHEIDISSIYLPLRFARYVASVFFVLYLANKTRDLIKW